MTQPLTPSQRDWLAESRDAAAWILVRDRFGHEHGLSDYIGPCIPEGPIRHKHAVGVSALQQASMPRERLRSIPSESDLLRIGISRIQRVTFAGDQFNEAGTAAQTRAVRRKQQIGFLHDDRLPTNKKRKMAPKSGPFLLQDATKRRPVKFASVKKFMP